MSSAFSWHDHNAALRRESVAAFNAFLTRARANLDAALDADATPDVHVMIGNEAADADSIVSSLVYAFHRDHVAHQQTATATATTTPPTVFVPVLPIPRDELALRCDVSALLAALEVETAALLFVDEFPWCHAKLPKDRLKLTLLDHNALNPKRLAAGAAPDDLGEVVEILDHHMDVGCHAGAPHREVAFADGQALVASCCTIVAERLLAAQRRSQSDDRVHALGATLLLAVIALDSVNLDPSAKKVTPRDVAAADALEPAAFATRGALFDWLQAEKFNVAHWDKFSIDNCLVCDYKEFQAAPPHGDGARYGVSAILIPLHRFVTKAPSAEGFVQALQSYVDANSLAFLVVMSMAHGADGSRRRELLIYEPGNDQASKKRCVAHFEADGTLDLEPLPALPLIAGDRRIAAFHQRNTGASRKQVVPLIQQALATVKL